MVLMIVKRILHKISSRRVRRLSNNEVIRKMVDSSFTKKYPIYYFEFKRRRAKGLL